MGWPLTLVASDTDVRILDGAAEIARHPRSYVRVRAGKRVFVSPECRIGDLARAAVSIGYFF